MTARSRMTERCTIQMTTPSPGDDWNQPGVTPWQTRTDNVPCWLWTDAAREVLGATSSVIADSRLLVPRSTVVSPQDRIVNVRDRLGAVKAAGPFNVLTVIDQHTHLEIALEQVS